MTELREKRVGRSFRLQLIYNLPCPWTVTATASNAKQTTNKYLYMVVNLKCIMMTTVHNVTL